MDSPFKSPFILSLCTGIRGLERGLIRALGPIRIAAYVENEAFVVENLLATMEAGMVAPAPIWTNLKTFSYGKFRNKIHGIISGYPCTPFSSAGHRKGEKDPRHLWPFIRTGISAARPVFCFFENSDDHITMGYDTVYKDLREMGYRVEAGIFSAEEVGAPHIRQRIFILAILADSNIYDTGRSIGNLLCQEREGVGEENKRKRDRDEPCARGEVMANSSGKRVRQGGSGEQSEQSEPDGLQRGNELEHPPGQRLKGQPYESGSIGEKTDREKQWRWPLRTDTAFQGWPAAQPTGNIDFQYPYEPPRTIKSRVEYSAYGYNFTGDLHRAIGNSVVEQTAEIAFIHLLKKHLKNGNR